MTAVPYPLARARLRPVPGWAGVLAIAAGLTAIVAARALAVRAGLDPLLVGAAFGGALVLLVIAARHRSGRRVRRLLVSPAVSVVLGAFVGLALVGIAVAGPAMAGVVTVPGIGRPAAPFGPWAAITLVVVAGEEGLLRGVLFDRLERLGGLAPPIALTSIAFALMHVPVYGWHVVPLDLAVGLVLAGLRVWTGGLAAPIAAHLVADLATWWL